MKKEISDKIIVAECQAFAAVIRELGSIPEGHLYAQVMGSMTLEHFNMIITVMKEAKLVRSSNHVLTWVTK